MDGVLIIPEGISTKTFVIIYKFFLMNLKIHELAMMVRNDSTKFINAKELWSSV